MYFDLSSVNNNIYSYPSEWHIFLTHSVPSDLFDKRTVHSHYSLSLPIITILGISWRDHATNEDVMRRVGMKRLQTLSLRVEGKWLATSFDCRAMCRVPEDGRLKRRRSKKTWRSTFKEDLKETSVSWHGACRIASDRERWRLLVARCSERNRRT